MFEHIFNFIQLQYKIAVHKKYTNYTQQLIMQ